MNGEDADERYRLLQRKFDRHVTGAPASPVLLRILKLLYSGEDAALAANVPIRPVTLEALSGRLALPPETLDERLTGLARRGLVIDFMSGGKRYFSLPPVVIGFFEFTFMRARDDLPMAELARLFDRYMKEDDRFARSVFRGRTQLGRSLVREESLPEGDHSEILDWERASAIVGGAKTVGLSLCACRHKAGHLEKACGRPVETCLSFDFAAETLIRSGMARPIPVPEAFGILERCKESGMAQTGDNVKRNVSYICNCCGCCCGMMEAIRLFRIHPAIVTSNWIAKVDPAKCRGCGKCAEACPVGIIAMKDRGEGKGRKRLAEPDRAACLGCGVCHSACRTGALRMAGRERKVLVPETAFDRIVSMAVERGKLAGLLFEDPEKLSHRALGRMLGILERSLPVKAALAVEPLRSVFLKTFLGGLRSILK
jgi:formate hydrogenlyase subunit 6/NADH:ubiquinone oxidoreductase subunit I